MPEVDDGLTHLETFLQDNLYLYAATLRLLLP